jgi:sodium/proline symporter
MSTADSQLLVVTSAVVEDFYVRLLRRKVDAARLVTISRFTTVAVAGVALWLAFRNRDFIFDSVEYAWTGLGSSFGPVLLLALRWKRFSKAGAFAGMLADMVSTIAWKNVDSLGSVLDMKLATFLIAFTAAILGSWIVPRRSPAGDSCVS